MKCVACQTELPDDAKYCIACGEKQERDCSVCNKSNPPSSRFCMACGHGLQPASSDPSRKEETQTIVPPFLEPPRQESGVKYISSDGERKFVSVLFSDLTGYSSLSEKLDPEEVKEITCRIFGEVSRIVAGYDGFIEKYAGDAVMAIFGVPNAHEDDPRSGLSGPPVKSTRRSMPSARRSKGRSAAPLPCTAVLTPAWW